MELRVLIFLIHIIFCVQTSKFVFYRFKAEIFSAFKHAFTYSQKFGLDFHKYIEEFFFLIKLREMLVVIKIVSIITDNIFKSF